MKKVLILLIVTFAIQLTFANNVIISNITKPEANKISFQVSWENSWNDGSYNDGIHLFSKSSSGGFNWNHLPIVSVVVSSSLQVVNAGTKSVMIKRSAIGTGTTTGTVTITFSASNTGPFPDFKVFAIEMVKVNGGAYYLGDGVSTSTYSQGNDVTKPYHVQSSGVLSAGSTASDINLGANVPAIYPNGFDSFYVFKYEITQEQYVEFLNTLTFAQQQTRTESNLNNISSSNRFVMYDGSSPDSRNGIACNANATNNQPINFYCDLDNDGNGNEINDGKNIACALLSVYDNLAYLDWAGLRPITSMEFEKACRGTNYPVGGEHANGLTTNVDFGAVTNGGKADESVVNVGTNGILLFTTDNQNSDVLRVGCLATATSTRTQSGASFYGILELSGNLMEICHSKTTSVNAHILGNGALDVSGNSNAWPIASLSFTEKGGDNYWQLLPVSHNFYTVLASDFDDRISVKRSLRGVYQF